MSKKGLGRGLGALIPEVEVGERDRAAIHEIEVRLIERNVRQPRKQFDPSRLEELAASIREHGVVQPIVLRPKGNGYEIVAGERRWRAAQLAGLQRIPALVKVFSEADAMEIALIENLQREDLNPLEEAEAFRILLDEFGLTQEELARRLGKSRPQITNTLRLLQLGVAGQEAVRSGELSMGHAKVLLGVEDPEVQSGLVTAVLYEGLSVRELEERVKRDAGQRGRSKQAKVRLGPDLQGVEQRLREWFGTPVRLVAGEKKGKIEITYFGEEGLGRIMDALGLVEGHSGPGPKGPFRV